MRHPRFRSACLALLAFAVSAPGLSAQDRKRGDSPPVLIPPSAEQPEKPSQEQPPQDESRPGPPNTAQEPLRAENLAARQAADPDPKQPRALPTGLNLPYQGNRKLIQVNSEFITTAELNQMVVYYQSYRPGVSDLQLRNAVQALLPLKVMADLYQDDLPAMRARVGEAMAARHNGLEWAEVVAQFSDDTEAENPEGKYTFGREQAVQPFDRFAHTGRVDQIQGPFLTVYGYHFLQILNYERGETAKDDRTTVRHVLVMYPDLKARAERGEDIRAYIKEQVAKAEVKVLERASQALLGPPKGN